MEFFNSIVGEWTGTGRGVFPPTVPEFHYSETLSIRATAKPNVWEIKSVTKAIPSGKPMHVEVGFIKVAPDSTSMIVSHPFGVAEISVATKTSPVSVQLNAGSDTVGSLTRTPCSKSPHATQIQRTYTLEGENKLSFSMEMATSTHLNMQNHLLANYTRTKTM